MPESGGWKPESVRRNIKWIPEYGRYDDLLVLLGTPCEADALSLIREQLARETGSVDSFDSLAVSYYNLASLGKAEDQKLYGDALQIWTTLANMCPENRAYAQRRDLVKNILAGGGQK